MLAETSEPIGIATNNVAEYRGLIAGLEEAIDLGADEVAVSMDSKLVVEQMAGRWKVKHPEMIELQPQARGLASPFDQVTYTWIPREQELACRPAGQRGDGRRRRAGAERGRNCGRVLAPGWTGATGAPTRLLLLRHGQTELSRERRYSGRGNPELTDLGRPGRRRREIPGRAGRHRRGGQLAAAARLRHRVGQRPRRWAWMSPSTTT